MAANMLAGLMRLPRRVQVLLASFLALTVTALGLDVVVLRARDDSSDRLEQTLAPAEVELQRLLTSLVDQETGERGFLLTGDDSFLQPYLDGRTDTERSLETLRTLLAGRDDLVAGLERLRSSVQAWQSLGADFEIDAKRDGRDAVVANLVAGGSGVRLFATTRMDVDDLAEELEAEADRARSRIEELDRLLLLIDLATLLVALAVLALAGYLARAWFTRPLEALGASVREVAGGALSNTIAADGVPELTELAADVDAMRRRILSELDEAERAREALADRGMVVMTLRDELAATAGDLPDGVSFAGRFSAAQGIVAGDWYDVIRLDDDHVAVALVDVSGHGAGAGAFALRTKTLTTAAMQMYEPGAALAWVASRLGDTGEQFLTGVILVLDAASGTVRYASAGHPPLLLGDVKGITELAPTGPIIGPIDGAWRTEEIVLQRGGVIVAYSDGVLEARDDRGDPFGIERLTDLVEASQLGGPDAVADACIGAVERHQVSREDDLTLVVLAR
jgi:serine phosphatase RsbU (regulator of sigma subunit)/CHASE3 domain sensor protein